MSIGGVIESLQQGASSGADRSLVFRTDAEFASTLTLGQIIKGKVLRHYEGGRYGMSFGGQEKVVDSALPLRPGELVHARVVGIDEKVHLQRMIGGPHENETGNGDLYNRAENLDSIARLFDLYQESLSSAQHALLKQLQGQLRGDNLVAVSALILRKLGVPLEPAFIRAIHCVLQRAEPHSAPVKSEAVQPSQAQTAGIGISPELVEGLASLIAGQAGLEDPEQDGHENVKEGAFNLEHPFPDISANGDSLGEDGHREHQEWLLGQWLLNAQIGGTVAHRFLRFPLWFGDRLVEVTLALFAQKEPGEDSRTEAGETFRYRKAVFALETENLGHLEIQVTLADQRLRLELAAESFAAAEYLGTRVMALESVLKEYGWQVDEITCRVRQGQGEVVRAVVEHYINQDSLSRLM